jgi:CubicO group peptidase (beta-lactamase class C family)
MPQSVRFRSRVFYLILLTFLASCGEKVIPDSSSKAAVGVTSENDLALSLEKYRVAGAAVALVKDGEVIYAKGFGHRDRERNLPVTADTLFPIGGLTKTFTATAVGALVDSMELTFDNPVHDFLPDFASQNDEVTKRASMQDFLAERSGMASHHLMFSLYPDNAAKIFSLLSSLPTAHAFGSSYHASDLNYLIAERVVERRTQQNLSDLLQEKLLAPLGLRHTLSHLSQHLDSWQMALPYRGLVPIEVPERKSALASSGIYSSVSDLGKWILFHINRGRSDGHQVISQHTMRQLHAAKVPVPPNANASMGWIRHSFRHLREVSHGSRMKGGAAYMAYLPELGIGVAVLSTGDNTWITHVISSYFLDQMLGIRGASLPERLEQRFVEEQANQAEELKKQITPSNPHRTPARAMPAAAIAKPAVFVPADIAGRYVHPAYGTLEIQVVSEKLNVSWGNVLKNAELQAQSDANGVPTLAVSTSKDDTHFPPIHLQQAPGEKQFTLFWRLDSDVAPIEFKRER